MTTDHPTSAASESATTPLAEITTGATVLPEEVRKLGADLEALSEAATPGEWMPAWYEAHDEDGGPSETLRDGIAVVPDNEDGRAIEHEAFISGREQDEDFVIALVNAYRGGRLTHASWAEHYMQLAMDRGRTLSAAPETPTAGGGETRSSIARVIDPEAYLDWVMWSRTRGAEREQACAEARGAADLSEVRWNAALDRADIVLAILAPSPATAGDGDLREALKQIIALAPETDPGPAFKGGWGYKSHGDYDDVADDARKEALWGAAEIARAAMNRADRRAADDATETTERDAFETWLSEYGFTPAHDDSGIGYADPRSNMSWDAWRAAHKHYAALARPQPAVDVPADRERIARIINPNAFLHGSPDYYGPNGDLAWFSAAQRVALKTADAILATRPTEPGGARGWSPIKTAPRDDRTVLLGWWSGAEDVGWRWVVVSGWFEAGPADRCWYGMDDERVEPTHWQPCDEPPAASTASSVEGER